MLHVFINIFFSDSGQTDQTDQLDKVLNNRISLKYLISVHVNNVQYESTIISIVRYLNNVTSDTSRVLDPNDKL